MKIVGRVAFLFFLLVSSAAFAQQPTFNDPLLEHLAGQWVLHGTIADKETTHDIKAEWVLAHQYLRIEETSREKNGQGQPAYAANVYVGWDGTTGQYVCVWLDVYGSISTQSLGQAKPAGDVIAFIFKDTQGKVAFHTVFTFDKAANSWTMQMDNEQDGKLSPFARTTLTRP